MQREVVFEPLLALLFGVLVGWIVQSVAARLRHNGKWVDLTRSKRRAMSASGAIAAFVVGLWILDHPRENPDTPYIYRLWFWQVLAAWLGSVLLDIGGRVLRTIIHSMAGGLVDDSERGSRGEVGERRGSGDP